MSNLFHPYSTLDAENNADTVINVLKQKRKELGIQKMEQDIQVRDQEIKAQSIENGLKEQARITNILTEYDRICASKTIDERARGLFKEAYLNSLTNSQVRVFFRLVMFNLTNSQDTGSSCS
jgi:hypothetical protein